LFIAGFSVAGLSTGGLAGAESSRFATGDAGFFTSIFSQVLESPTSDPALQTILLHFSPSAL
jgi:hypothetical protein